MRHQGLKTTKMEWQEAWERAQQRADDLQVELSKTRRLLVAASIPETLDGRQLASHEMVGYLVGERDQARMACVRAVEFLRQHGLDEEADHVTHIADMR